MPIAKPQVFNLPRLLLCEGPEDRWFFKELIEVRGLPNFHIEDTSHESNQRGGNTQFGRKLRVLQVNRPSFRQIAHVLIVSDNDDSQRRNFAAICQQLTDNGFPAPGTLLQRTAGRPTISIMMLPMDPVVGNLEATCIDAARFADRAVGGHVDMFCASVRADAWPADKCAKLWLRVALSARNQNDPFIPLGRAFGDGMIPLNHRSLDPIADVLRGYGP